MRLSLKFDACLDGPFLLSKTILTAAQPRASTTRPTQVMIPDTLDILFSQYKHLHRDNIKLKINVIANNLMISPKVQFDKAKSLRRSLSLPLRVEQLCLYIESLLGDNKGSGMVCCGNTQEAMVEAPFRRAFQKMSKEDQMEYYIFIVEYAQNSNVKPKYDLEESLITFQGFYGEKGTFSYKWEKSGVEVSAEKGKITVIGKVPITIDLRGYLIRKSNASDKYTLALESTTENTTIRIRFLEWSVFNKCYNVLITVTLLSHVEVLFNVKNVQPGRSDKDDREEKSNNIEREQKNIETNRKSGDKSMLARRLLTPYQTSKSMTGGLIESGYTHSIRKVRLQKQESVIKSPQREVDHPERSGPKKFTNIFRQLMPEYNLDKLESLVDYQLVKFSSQHKIFKHKVISNRFKLVASLPYNKKNVLSLISDPLTHPSWNQEVQVSDVKCEIQSDNSVVAYEVHKAYSEFHHIRDYLYIRHLFENNGKTYMIDQSIENSDYPPFSKVVRGTISYGLWMIEEVEDQSLVYLELETTAGGKLNPIQSNILTIRYLEAISGLKIANEIDWRNRTSLFDTHWDITSNEKTLRQTEMKRLQELSDDESSKSESEECSVFDTNVCEEIEDYFSVINDEVSINQNLIDIESQLIEEDTKEIVKPLASLNLSKYKILFDAQGNVQISSEYLRKNHKRHPYQCAYTPSKAKGNKSFWRPDWKISQEGVVLANNVDKKEQLSRVFLNINRILKAGPRQSTRSAHLLLPADSLGTQSLLERVARSFGLAPKFLSKAAKMIDVLDRFKLAMAVGFSSVLMMAADSLTEPFYPIVGETYQGWLNGCPVYCQQLSQHPPITSVLMVGRGYTIFGTLEFKVDHDQRKETFKNVGHYLIEFADGQRIEFHPPNTEIVETPKELAVESHLNLVGKCMCFDRANHLSGVIVFNPSRKRLSPTREPEDTLNGSISKVTASYIQSLKNNTKIDDRDEIEKVCDISGRWTSHLDFENTRLYTVDEDLPCVLENEKYPLESSCSYRPDILFRKQEEYPQAQIEKERLEAKERKDLLLRENSRKN